MLVATGGRAFRHEFPGWELAVTSDHMFHLPDRPERIVIVGGGYIAAEFAAITNGVGSKVTQLYRGELFLRGFDREIRLALADAMRARGIDLRFSTEVSRLERVGGSLRATLLDGATIDTDARADRGGTIPHHHRPRPRARRRRGRRQRRDRHRSALPVDGSPHLRDRGLRRAHPRHGPHADRHRRGDGRGRHRLSRPPDRARLHQRPHRGLQRPLPRLRRVDRRRGARPGSARSTSIGRRSCRSRARCPAASERTLMKLLVDAATDRVVGAHMLGPSRGGDHPGARDRDHRRGHQGAVRRHHRDPSHRGRGVRDHADARGVMTLLLVVDARGGAAKVPRRPISRSSPCRPPARDGSATATRWWRGCTTAGRRRPPRRPPSASRSSRERSRGHRRRAQRRRWRRERPSRSGSSRCRCPPGSVAWRRPRTPTVEWESRTRATTRARCRAIRSSRAARRIHHRPPASSCASRSPHLPPAPPSK